MIRPPAQLFGSLFTAVQQAKVFADSKAMADAVPRRPVADIMGEWAGHAAATLDELRVFVRRNFDIPDHVEVSERGTLPLEDHIDQLWRALERPPVDPREGSSEIALPCPFLVPGGRFRELYYWDSYFTLLGLTGEGARTRIANAIRNFGSLFDRFGHVPNGTRTYYLGRSQPPVFYLVAGLSPDQDDASRRQRLNWMRIEHRFWMEGADALAPGSSHRRVVRLADGALLNRYWDDDDGPRDESWREDQALAAEAPERDARELWRDPRAAAESGWDFSSRWLGNGASLATIRTTRILPIDLNCLLHGLEQTIAAEAEALGDGRTGTSFAALARARAEAIDKHLWNEAGGFYADCNIDSGECSSQLTAATAFALFTGQCPPARAERLAGAIHGLLRPGGLATTATATGQQWDAPNGWAPLQWAAIAGLRRYGFADLADTIGQRWIAMVARHYRDTGLLLEKYNVESEEAGSGGEYSIQTGFGWTNGVTRALMENGPNHPASRT